jgi:prepilin-type N-terminal cleavage/methylation domain-containing protein
MRTSINKRRAGAKACLVGNERGFGLVETLVAVAILGVAVVALVLGLSTGSITVGEGNQEMVAQSLAQTQLEYVKDYPYDPAATTYPTVDAPEGYSIGVEAGSIPGADTDIQRITVTISRDGEAILTVEDYKVDR